MRAPRQSVGVAIITALCAVLCTIRLGTHSLWLDEAFSASYAHLSFGGLWTVITGPDPNMSLYYELLRLWSRVFGETEAALRSLSVVSAILAIPLIVVLGTRLFGRTVGLLAGMLLATDACLIQYAQTVRSYSLLVLLTLGSSYLLLGALKQPSRGRLAAYAVLATLSVYAHYFAALVLVAHAFGVITSDAWKRARDPWIVTAAAIVSLCVPEAVAAHGHGGNIAWITKPSLHDLVTFPVFLTAGGGRFGHLPELGAGLIAALALYGLCTQWRGERAWEIRFVSFWLVEPVILTFVESRIGKPLWVTVHDSHQLATHPADHFRLAR